MTDTLTYTGKLTILNCGVCSVRHAIPTEMYEDRSANGGNWWCPNGHHLHFVTTEATNLKKRLEAEKWNQKLTLAALSSTRDQLQATQNSLRAQKAAKTRLKNRIAAGVCPCCKRHFENVQRHMDGQHPGFAATPEETR